VNKPLRRVAIFCGLLIFSLLLRDNWLQFVDGDSHKTTGDSDFQYERTYTDGPEWAPVTGLASQVYGTTLLEGVEDKILTGDDDRLFFNRTIDMLTGKQQQGGDVVTTLNSKAQDAAFKGLGDKKGAVAAINPQTGAILALASTPSYDPGTIADGSAKDSKAWSALLADKNQPMLNRALRQTYPPGSTFKIVTAAAALDNGLYSSIDDPTDSPLPYTLPGTTTTLNNEGPLPCHNATLKVALEVSCNTVFGHMGAQLGQAKMLAQADKFGFNKSLDIPVRTVASNFSNGMNSSQVALSSIGQFNTAATPLQMAMVAGAVANNGKLMTPYMVDQLRAPNLNVVQENSPKELDQAMTPQTAQKIQGMMEAVVSGGTGTMAQIPGVTVGGKTGTAQHGENNSGLPYAWFISYAKTAQGSPVAVAVVVEDGNANREEISGGGLAAPIAKSVMEAVLNK
jgi:peptidoglycan glycosyltransferase